MATLTIHHPFTTTQPDAVQRVSKAIEALGAKHGASGQWRTQTEYELQQPAKGKITIGLNVVIVTAELSFLQSLAKSAIESTIKNELEIAFR